MRKQDVVKPDFRTTEGFKELYNTYWKLRYRLCQKYTDDAESSKELVQEIFESLWKNRDKLVIEKDIENYLVKSAKLKAFQFIRNKVSRLEKLDAQSQLSPDPYNETENEVDLNLLKQRVSSLVTPIA